MEYSFITTPYRIDRKLYKYFSNVKYAIDSIRGRHIHLDNPQDFNDPFDVTVGLFQYTTLQEYDTPSEVMQNMMVSFGWIARFPVLAKCGIQYSCGRTMQIAIAVSVWSMTFQS